MPYEIIYADFPWPYTAFGTARLSYQQMTESEIAAFDWSPYLAKRAVVFSWVTGPRLDMALRCAEHWRQRHGLHYQGIAYIWVKTTLAGIPIKASGPRPRLVKPLDELILAFSTTPNERTFPLLTESQVQHVFAPKQRLHSRKPAIFRELIVELLGERPRIELFARETAVGWANHGLEVPSCRADPDPVALQVSIADAFGSHIPTTRRSRWRVRGGVAAGMGSRSDGEQQCGKAGP